MSDALPRAFSPDLVDLELAVSTFNDEAIAARHRARRK
jgi:hypothetical protein